MGCYGILEKMAAERVEKMAIVTPPAKMDADRANWHTLKSEIRGKPGPWNGSCPSAIFSCRLFDDAT